MEDFKTLPNLSKYKIYKNGTIVRTYRTAPDREIHNVTKNGYLTIALSCDDGVRRSMMVHRLVARAFVPNPENLFVVRHKDGNQLNVNADNLYWCGNDEYDRIKIGFRRKAKK